MPHDARKPARDRRRGKEQTNQDGNSGGVEKEGNAQVGCLLACALMRNLAALVWRFVLRKFSAMTTGLEKGRGLRSTRPPSYSANY
jgi:hypothetical protein